MRPDLETRRFALEMAIQIVLRGDGESWGRRSAAALELAKEFETHLDPPPPTHAQADAKKAA